MSAQQAKTHPAVQQVSNQASFYVSQLDKEVSLSHSLNSVAQPPLLTLDLFQLSKYPALNNLEQRTQVPKAYAALGACGLITLRKWLFSTCGSRDIILISSHDSDFHQRVCGPGLKPDRMGAPSLPLAQGD